LFVYTSTEVHKYFFASLLFWLDKFNNDLGWNNRVTQRMIDVGKHFDINLKTLKEWGASVGKDLNTRITHTTQSVDDVCKVLDILQDKIIELSSKLDKADSKISEMSTKLDAMSVLMHDMHSHIMGQATKNPKEKEPEEGAVTTASQDVPTASITTKKPAKDVVSVLMAGSKRATNSTHFKDSLKWPVQRLISEVVIEKFKIKEANIPSMSKQQKFRLRTVWKAIETSCNNEQKMMLTHQVATPDPSSPEYNSFQKKVRAMAMEIESKAFETARNDHKALFGDAKTSVKVSTSTLYNLIDKVKKSKNKKNSNEGETKEN
jgi:hypothetical protein